MKLLTDEIKKAFEKHPLYSQEGKGMDSVVIVKYFNPVGSGTWIITEAEKQLDGDWLLFGYCHISCWEWGCVSLNELKSIRLPFGLTIEQDVYIRKGATVKELIK